MIRIVSVFLILRLKKLANEPEKHRFAANLAEGFLQNYGGRAHTAKPDGQSAVKYKRSYNDGCGSYDLESVRLAFAIYAAQ